VVVVRRRCRRPIQVQLIIIVLNLHNMEDILLRSLVIILSLVQDGEVTDSPSLEVVHLPFPVETEYRSLTVKHLLYSAPLLSLMVDIKHLLDLLHTLVDTILLLDLHTVAVDTILLLDLHTVAVDILLLDLHTVAVDIILLLDLLHTVVDIILLLDLLHTVAVDTMHLLDLL
jgi:hypothetical protein